MFSGAWLMEENFIPYVQIEPLLRPGMLAAELRDEIFRRLGLDAAKYVLITNGGADLPLPLALQRGVHVRKLDYPRFARVALGDEVVCNEV